MRRRRVGTTISAAGGVDGTLTFLGDPADDVAAVRDGGKYRGIACGNPLEDRFRLSVEALIRWIVKD